MAQPQKKDILLDQPVSVNWLITKPLRRINFIPDYLKLYVMKITRLSWAGLMLETETTTLYIDPLQNAAELAPIIGTPKFPVFPVPFPQNKKVHVLVTHIHQDHFDLRFLTELLATGGTLWAPEPVCSLALENGLKAFAVKIYEPLALGDFKITPVPAVDWVGDEQVSYVIGHGKSTIFHGGDTNWHGYWWKFKKFGPYRLAFLPVNGVVGSLPYISPDSNIQGTMNPAEAVTATRIMGAAELVPIHYGQFDFPPHYTEYPDLENALKRAAAEQKVAIRWMKDGETAELFNPVLLKTAQ